jgi:hypothetical protein
MRAGRRGFAGLRQDWRGRSRHRALGPGEGHQDEEPEECAQDERRENMRRSHGVAPSNMGGDGGIVPGFGVV